VLQALGVDFAVNTDARSVLVSSPWEQLVADRPLFERSDGNDVFRSELHYSFYGTVEATSSGPLQLLDEARLELPFDVSVGPLTSLPGWVVSEQAVEANDDDLSLVHVSVTCSHREVDSWDQPLLASSVEGEVRLLCQQRNGILQFLFCVTPEVGFTERAQFGPSIQTHGGPAMSSTVLTERERIIRDFAQDAERRLTVLQSDEGGRFMHCVGRYSIDLIAPDVTVPDLRWATWMPLSTIVELLPRQGVFTNEARSALSLLLTEL
jgi:dTDP-4-dehydro-6-deoxy-alpha-D-glucopyranose 2,3-dehydratase